MTHVHLPLQRSNRLSVLTCRTARPDAEMKDWFGVRCPRRWGTAALTDCARCDDGDGVGVDADERRTFLACRWQEKSPARDARPEARPDRVSVLDVMSEDTLCVAPDLSLDALTGVLIARGVSGAPVVDEDGRPLGMVSKSDLVREQQENGRGLEIERFDRTGEGGVDELGQGFHLEQVRQGTVRDIMTPVTFSLGEGASLARAAALMAYERVHRVPVISRDGRVVGVVSALDGARWVARNAGFCVR
jgi:CBS domain-containing protein